MRENSPKNTSPFFQKVSHFCIQCQFFSYISNVILETKDKPRPSTIQPENSNLSLIETFWGPKIVFGAIKWTKLSLLSFFPANFTFSLSFLISHPAMHLITTEKHERYWIKLMLRSQKVIITNNFDCLGKWEKLNFKFCGPWAFHLSVSLFG